MNWLDYLLLLLLLLSVAAGVKRGFTRTILGLIAAILGLVLACWFYGTVGGFLREFVSHPKIAHLIGFFIIFVTMLVLGAVGGILLAKLWQKAGLSWLDRLLGGLFGILRGVLVGMVLILALLAFSAKPPPRSVAGSRLAPYVIDVTCAMAGIAPYELQEGVHRSYEELKKVWQELVRPEAKPLPRQEL